MSFTFCTYNLAHGQGTDAQFNFQRQVDVFASSDLVGVQEWTAAETGWNTPLSNAGFSQSIYKANQIGGSDGNRILYKSSTVTILNTYEVQLSIGAQTGWSGTNVDKCAVAVKAQMEGQKFYFVNTHLCQSAGADVQGGLTSTIRENQIRTLLTFADQNLLGHDIALVADFNYGPAHLLNAGGFMIDLFLRAGFVDLWREGISRGTATSYMTVNDTTPTADTRRIDGQYFKTVNRALTFTGITHKDSRATCSTALTGDPQFCPDTNSSMRWGTAKDYGVTPSDHDAVESTGTINQRAVSPVRRTNFSWLPNVTL